MKLGIPLPEARRLPWPLRELSSAETQLKYDQYGRMVLSIAHQPLRGLTPDMLAWWFRNIGGAMDVEGQIIDRYLDWHPLDHIRWELIRSSPDGSVGVGSRFRIVEAFGADPRHYVDVIDTVVRLDNSGITLVNRGLAGMEVARLTHDFTLVERGALYCSTLTVGVRVPLLGRLINAVLHRIYFPEEMGRAWNLHNVEEVGMLEHILPMLHPGEARSKNRAATALLLCRLESHPSN